ncbi:hypothetical protein ACFV84_14455 [Kitasatospora sp. NPDC059811]|uniref:hypothetical protein n=1 Tax=Streptomycetaceae TaxID=2062 RepID=UPI000A979D64|nr:hypothetical protein [Streptomyces sp. MJM8645]
MNRTLRNALVAVAAAGALGAAAAAPAMAAGTTPAQPTARVQAQLSNPKTVKADDFNKARDILIKAGSKTAEKTHPSHGVKDVPVSYGTSLLAEARDEFRAADKNLPEKDKQSGMSHAHYKAVHDAAKKMGIDTW